MDCIYCGKPAGFIRSYHKECKQKFKEYEIWTTKVSKAILDKQLSNMDAKRELLLAANKNEVKNYFDTNFDSIQNEIAIKEYYSYSMAERKNHVTFKRTGISYRRYPIYKDEISSLGEAIILLTDKSIYIIRNEQKNIKIINSSIISIRIVNLDIIISVKTSSSIPHEYYFRDFFGDNELYYLMKSLLS